MSPALPPFDIAGPLPEGVAVLEASAGTGKTSAIAGLAVRLVAEGTPIGSILLITFTRMATGELRDRVRARLVAAEDALAGVLRGDPPPALDEVVALLARGTPDEVAARHERLQRAVRGFDVAAIATTHAFCQEVLRGLGLVAGVGPGTAFAEDLSDLREEVVADLLVRRARDGAPAVAARDARLIAERVVRDPFARIVPGPGTAGAPGARADLARAARAGLERRKRARGIITYDDFLVRLRDTLADPVRGPEACAILRRRFRAVLVDEFQDTDPVQWEILDLAFARGGVRMVLIGDPKQAIYAFRGADVRAYLDAAGAAGTRATLGVNWRSDQGFVEALDALFAGAALGDAGIPYRTVRAAPANQAPRLSGAPSPAPLRVRVVDRRDGVTLTAAMGLVQKGAGREWVAEDLAADVVRLLAAGAAVEVRDADGRTVGREPVGPGHLAVLARTHDRLALVREALDAAGVPAVLTGAGSVFATRAARDWRALLRALERPAAPGRVAECALTPFAGWDAARLAAAGDRERAGLSARLHRWADVLEQHGVAALVQVVTREQSLPARVLARADGARDLTDLRHVAHLLHAAAHEEGLGTPALAAWLERRIADAGAEAVDEGRARRLESDAAAVRLVTFHAAKGLEFPIVYLPFAWEPSWVPDPDDRRCLPAYHDPARSGARTVDVGGEDAPEFEEHARLSLGEDRGEDLRLLYVALTRARHQAVLWWAAGQDAGDSALGRLLAPRTAGGAVPVAGGPPPADEAMRGRLEALSRASGGRVAVERSRPGTPARWMPPAVRPPALDAARLGRPIDHAWRRTSYSALTEDHHDPAVASEPEGARADDEAPGAPAGAPAMPGDPDEQALRRVPSPLEGVPGGTATGTLVHRVLESVDLAADDLDVALAEAVAREAGRRPVDGLDPGVLAAGLRAAVETPLGPDLGGLRLRDVDGARRLSELAFELPLAGGDRPSAEVGIGDVAALLRRHLAPADPIAPYPDRLAALAGPDPLRGYLVGSVDLVVRTPAGGWVVVDHKTNRLGAPDEPMSAWHYRPAALTEAMMASHYVLQGLLYGVAVHRYLRWRDPARAAGEPGAIAYCFLRGMCGPRTPVVGGRPCGVFAWRPPRGLVPALSDLLDRGAG
ncbi:MAG: UvrD-helicase domain-containing protein [Thermoleophilia bacterium]|nr:UvrD-helicase domain-containing protein [Thermoleophilia bacterium]